MKAALVKRARLISPIVKVRVTDNMILESQMSDSSHCMIASAVKAAVPNAAYVSVDLATIRFTDPEKGLRYTYFTPRIAQVSLLNYDQGRLPEPFEFQLRSAGQIRRAGWKANHPNSKERTVSEETKTKKRKKNKKTLKGSAVHNGPAIPRTGTRRAFGLRAFIMGGTVGKGAGV